ncbi:MAG: 50S ribosomal protein L29 [Chloroflexi bacterium]|nr:50S ribosomal protein L29 [Chloroflexota bacterium]
MAHVDEIRVLGDDQLHEELENARREVFNLRFRAATRQLANTTEVSHARRRVARVLTVIRERELGAVATVAVQEEEQVDA